MEIKCVLSKRLSVSLGETIGTSISYLSVYQLLLVHLFTFLGRDSV